MKTNKINCFSCIHFYVTWDKRFPRGCRAYGFKTKQLPSVYVLHASQEKCLKYEEKSVRR